MTELAARPQEPVSVGEATERAKEKGAELKQQAGDRLRQEMESRAQQAGEQVQTFSQSVRRTASELRAQGQPGQAEAFDQLAIRAEQIAGYLSQSDPEQLLSDAREYGGRVTSFLRQQPALLAFAGVGAGVAASLLAGRIRSQQA